MHDLISINQITKVSEVARIFRTAADMEKIVKSRKTASFLRNKTVAELFYQPSTRTFSSFLAACKWLGCERVIAIHGMSQYSSAVKGETLKDTVRTIEQTTACDAIILRHPDDDSAQVAAEWASVPVINAGSGKKEHPTQALLDLYTIKKRLGKMTGLRVGFLGDLLNGRTVKSLSRLLTVVDKNPKIFLISPKVLKLPKIDYDYLQLRGAELTVTESLDKVIGGLDVLYVTRIQSEWFKTPVEKKLYASLKGQYDITPKVLEKAEKNLIVMHPLPRVGEISEAVDADPRAAYFEQMRNGLYVRMAILKLILCQK
ncbi:MAG: aspartate carbamoyltransferase [Patescibacteria group bacterium]